MGNHDLQPVADALLRLAKRQGHVSARDVRAEMRMAGLAEERWQEAVALVEPPLVQRRGRFYLKDSVSPRMQKQQAQQQTIAKFIRKLIRQHKSRAKSDERRRQARVDFIHPVKIRTEDGKEHTLMSRDLSTTGVRLLGTKGLLGQKVQLELADGSEATCRLTVRILWTCAVGDNLFENGGSFVELLD